jgi:hypothetical protein
MKVKELIQQLSSMNPENSVFLAIYHPDDSGNQDHYTAIDVVEYNSCAPEERHVQIKGE